MATIGIKYNEGGNPLGYESVYIYLDDKTELLFDTGDFVKDWYDAIKKFITGIPESLSHSSTCNHFQGDGGKFDSGYLHMVDDKPILKYLDTSEENWLYTQKDIYEGGIEFFIPEGTQPTWEELKEMCETK